MNFDKPKFAKILKDLISDRSINKFAEESGVSAAHISRLLRQKIDFPPHPYVLLQLSGGYHSLHYYDLIKACGYI